MNTSLILCTPPDFLYAAVPYGLPLAHMSYQLGANFQLFRANGTQPLHGGLMILGDDLDEMADGDPESLTMAVMNECEHCGFYGVSLTFSRTSPAKRAFVARLSGQLRQAGKWLYLPEIYAGDSDWAKILIPTALSGGNLQSRLQEVIAVYGAGRICLDIERVRRDFCLPCRTGAGEKLSAAAFQTLIHTHNPPAFFSQDLCAYYFTYQMQNTPHVVLYDDAVSIRKKTFLAAKLGIDSVFLLYPEVEDILPSVLS